MSLATSGGVCSRSSLTTPTISATDSSRASRVSSEWISTALGTPEIRSRPADLELSRQVRGVGAAEHELQSLGRLVPDQEIELPAHEVLQRFIEARLRHPKRPRGHDPGDRDDRRLGRPAADVEDEMSLRPLFGEPEPDRRRDDLGQHADLARTDLLAAFLDRAPLDRREIEGNRNREPRAAKRAEKSRLVREVAKHRLHAIEIRDGAAANRPYDGDFLRRPPDHVRRLDADRKHLATVRPTLARGDQVRLDRDEPLAPHVDAHRRAAEIDRHVLSECTEDGHRRPPREGDATVDVASLASADEWPARPALVSENVSKCRSKPDAALALADRWCRSDCATHLQHARKERAT